MSGYTWYVIVNIVIGLLVAGVGFSVIWTDWWIVNNNKEDSNMYKGKPVIIGNRPKWRHPVFPWGWYSLTKDGHRIEMTDGITADGYYNPSDDAAGRFVFDDANTSQDKDVKLNPEDDPFKDLEEL